MTDSSNLRGSTISKVIWILCPIFLIGSLVGIVLCSKGLHKTNTKTIPQHVPYDYDNSIEEDNKSLKKDYTMGLIVCVIVFVSTALLLIIDYNKNRELKRVAPVLPVTNNNNQTSEVIRTNVNGKRTTIINNTTNITTCSDWTLLCCCVRTETTETVTTPN